MQFSVEPVELTAQVAVTRAADGKIGWNLPGIGGFVGVGEHADADVEAGAGVEETGWNAGADRL